jgi:hypothetical protein
VVVSSATREVTGRVIYGRAARGVALVTAAPISFFGGFDLDTGVVTDAEHPLVGECVAGRVLVFPTGKGSTVGSYALLRLAEAGVAPAALVMRACDTTVAVGAIIAEIPCVDGVDPALVATGDTVEVDAEGRVRVS